MDIFFFNYREKKYDSLFFLSLSVRTIGQTMVSFETHHDENVYESVLGRVLKFTINAASALLFIAFIV